MNMLKVFTMGGRLLSIGMHWLIDAMRFLTEVK
jgi:hypothetical protein